MKPCRLGGAMGTPGRSAQLGGASRSPCKASAAAFLLRCRQLASKNTRRCHAVLPARARKQLGAAFGSILCPCRCASPGAAPFPRPAGTGPPRSHGWCHLDEQRAQGARGQAQPSETSAGVAKAADRVDVSNNPLQNTPKWVCRARGLAPARLVMPTGVRAEQRGRISPANTEQP